MSARMASLQSTCCRPQRCLQLPCRAEQVVSSTNKAQLPLSSRRSALSAAVLLPAAAAVAAAVAAPRPAVAEEAAAALAPAPAISAAEAALDVSNWPMWVDRNFSFNYPPGLLIVEDLTYAAPPRPRAGADQVSENPLKAELRSEDGSQRVNVVVKQAAAIKRTLFQVTDISQLGDPRAVAKLLLPPGAAVLSVQTVCVEQPAKDTGTMLGVIQRDPVNYFSYEVLLPDRTHAQLTAAAQLGRLYLLGASAPETQWQECGAALKEAALSFRLRYKT